MGVDEKEIHTHDLAPGKQIVFSATGITHELCATLAVVPARTPS